jgi:hypothetical protein
MGSRRIFAQADVARALRGWQDYHMDDRGWSDIAYQVAVDQAGRVWTLRGLQTRSGANGDEDANLAYGAALLVLGSGESPTGAMINATRQVIADFRRLYPKATEIRPHSAVRVEYTGSGTDCPGDAARGLIAAHQFDPTPTHEETDEMTPDDIQKFLETVIRKDGLRVRDALAAADFASDQLAESGKLLPLVHAMAADIAAIKAKLG